MLDEKRKKEKEEEKMRQKAFSEKVAKAERVLSAFKESMAAGNLNDNDSDSADIVDVAGEEPDMDNVPVDSPRTPNQEVTSTVTIPTPEVEYDEKCSPTVWKGDIDMPDVAAFSVSAQAVSGHTDYLTLDLRDSLKIVGRIPPKTVWEYIDQLNEAQTKEILLIRLQPATDDEKANYEAFFTYLQGRQRFGVVGNNSPMVKDCYILPLGSKDQLNDCLVPCDGPGLEEERPNLLLALVVRSKRKRPGLKKEHRIITLKKKNQPESKAKSPSPPEDQIPPEDEYDPALAGDVTIELDDSPDDESSKAKEDEEVYDPESAFDEEGPEAKRQKTSSPPPKPLTSSSGGFTEELAKLTKEIEKQKAELASISKDSPTSDDTGKKESASFQGLPNNIVNILFGESGPSSSSAERATATANQAKSKSSLSSMSDADLLAKVQEMETGPPREAPPTAAPNFSQSFPPSQMQPPYGGPPPPGPGQYSDPNWMNTGPPPLPPVSQMHYQGPPQPHAMHGGGPPWMQDGPPPGPWQHGGPPHPGHQFPQQGDGPPPRWQDTVRRGGGHDMYDDRRGGDRGGRWGDGDRRRRGGHGHQGRRGDRSRSPPRNKEGRMHRGGGAAYDP